MPVTHSRCAETWWAMPTWPRARRAGGLQTSMRNAARRRDLGRRRGCCYSQPSFVGQRSIRAQTGRYSVAARRAGWPCPAAHPRRVMTHGCSCSARGPEAPWSLRATDDRRRSGHCAVRSRGSRPSTVLRRARRCARTAYGIAVRGPAGRRRRWWVLPSRVASPLDPGQVKTELSGEWARSGRAQTWAAGRHGRRLPGRSRPRPAAAIDGRA